MKKIQNSLKKKKKSDTVFFEKEKTQKTSKKAHYMRELDHAIEKEIEPVMNKNNSTKKGYVGLANRSKNWYTSLRKHTKKNCAKNSLFEIQMDDFTSCATLLDQKKSQKPRGTSMSTSIHLAVKNDPSRDNQPKDENRWFGSGRSSSNCHIRNSINLHDRPSISRSKSHSAKKNSKPTKRRPNLDAEDESLHNDPFQSAKKDQTVSGDKTFTGLKRSTVDRHVPFFKIPSDKISSITETPQLPKSTIQFNQIAPDSEMIPGSYVDNISDRYSRNSKEIRKMNLSNKDNYTNGGSNPFRSARNLDEGKDVNEIQSYLSNRGNLVDDYFKTVSDIDLKLAVKEQSRKEQIKYDLQCEKDYKRNIDRIVDSRQNQERENIKRIEDAKEKVRSL